MPNKRERLGDLNAIAVSAHFHLSEFECRGGLCCGYTVKIMPMLLTVLELIRARINQHDKTARHRLLIISGYRCPRHNKEVGGIHHTLDPLDCRNSLHTHGMAADITCTTIPKRQLAYICRDLAENGPIPFRVGFYTNQTGASVLHIDLLDWENVGHTQIFGNGWEA